MRVVKADVVEDLAGMRVGWELNAQGVGRGEHFANCFQDPTVVCPSMAGSKFRTTLVRDSGQWLVMELLGRTAFGSPNSIYLSNPKNGHQTNRTVQ